MKILFIATSMALYGANKSLLDISSKLAEKNEVYVLFPGKDDVITDKFADKGVKVIHGRYYNWIDGRGNQLRWILKKLRWMLYRQFVNHITAKRIAKIICTEEIDIIHTNNSASNLGGILKKLTNRKHVWHIREFGDLDYQMQPLLNRKRHYKFMNQYTDAFICISDAIVNHYRNLDKRKCYRIYNGVDESNMISENDKVAHSTINILIAGYISESKGQDQAIKACEMLLDKGVKNFHLFIAGGGKLFFNIKPEIRTHVTLLGQVVDMAELRRKIDIELMCSKAEAFGRVIAEAMLGGIPIVGSDGGACSELILDNINGLIYKYGDIESLYEKINLLIKNPTLRKIMGDNAREYAQNRFLSTICVNEIEKVYAEIL